MLNILFRPQCVGTIKLITVSAVWYIISQVHTETFIEFLKYEFLSFMLENLMSAFVGPIEKVSIGSVNGLAPNRWQAITWFNDDPVHSRIYVSPKLTHLRAKLPINLPRPGNVWWHNVCWTLLLPTEIHVWSPQYTKHHLLSNPTDAQTYVKKKKIYSWGYLTSR